MNPLIQISPPIDIRGQPLKSIDHYIIKPEIYQKDIKGVLITEGEIRSRVDRMAEDISRRYHPDEFFALCIADGAIKFYADLLSSHRMWAPFEVGTESASSYDGTESTGKVDLGNFDFSRIEGKDILIVEDIIDTGETLATLITRLKKHNPKNIEIACLLNKPERRLTKFEDIEVNYCGFIVPDRFVVGYWLDFNNRYRGLNHLCVLKEDVYKGKGE